MSSCTATAAIASEIEAGIANRTTLLVKSPLAQLGGFVREMKTAGMPRVKKRGERCVTGEEREVQA